MIFKLFIILLIFPIVTSCKNEVVLSKGGLIFTEESLHKGNKCLVTIAYNYVEKEKSIEYEYYPMIVRLPDVDKNLIMFSGNAKNQLKVGNSFFSPTKESGEILLLNADGEISKLTQKKWDISIRGENGIVEKHRLEDLLNE